MRRILPLLITLVALPAFAQGDESRPVLPGYWESDSRVTSPKGKESIEKRCLMPDQVDKFLESGVSNKNYTCKYPTEEIKDGHILMKGRCVDKNGFGFHIVGEGTYTHTELHLKAKAVPALGGLVIPITFKAALDAHRLGDVCPPGTKKF
jgi:hypothetical protein